MQETNLPEDAAADATDAAGVSDSALSGAQISLPENAPSPLAPKEPRKDGFIEYLFNEEGVFVMLNPPQSGGRSVPMEELKKDLLKRGFKNLTQEDSLLSIYRSRGKPAKISGPLFDVEKKDGYFRLETSKDGVEAYLYVTPPWGGNAAGYEEVLAEMERKEIVFGVDHEAIKTALREAREDAPCLVAKGIEPVQGKDAEMQYFFERDAKAAPKELEDGRVDYRELNLVVSVSKGTLLAEKIPATEGTPGKSVYGKELAAKRGRDFIPPVGKGVERSEDGRRLLAAADGCPVVAGKQLKVLPVYDIKGDVDFSTGNIYFMGSVVVRGNVKSGFKIVSSGNVEIYQGVEDARIEAEGKVLVKRGISGQGKAFIKAGEDVLAKFIQHAEVRTKESVHTEACLHSTIYAGKKVAVGGKRGLIVGGLIRAGLEVNAKTVGSAFATPTEIEVGIDPQIREDLLRVSNQLAADAEGLKSANKGLEHLEKIAQSGGTLPGDKVILRDRLRQTKHKLEERMAELKEKRRVCKEQIMESPMGKLVVKELLHPGVKVSFKQSTQTTAEEKKGVCLYEVEGQIKEGAA